MGELTLKFGLLNVNKQWGGNGEALEREMRKRELDYGLFVEVKAKPSQRHPLRGVIAAALYETPVMERRNDRGGKSAKNGVVCVQGDNIDVNKQIMIRILEQDNEARWMILDFSGVIICVVYISPSEPVDTYQQLEDAVNRIETQHPNSPIIITGDLNIRLRRFGDSVDLGDRRKRGWMEEMVDEKGWNRVEPVRGRFTTVGRSGGGGGVTDIILTNAAAEAIVTDLVVHDGSGGEDVYAYSDHHLLSFSVRIPTATTRPAFSRIDVRKLNTRSAEYEAKLTETMLAVKQGLKLATVRVERATFRGEQLSAEYRQGLIDAAEEDVVTWMTSAAKQTAGVMKFRGGEIAAPLAEEHVSRLRVIYEEMHGIARRMSAQRIGSREDRIKAWGEARVARAILKRAIRRSRKRLFDASNDILARNAPGDAKRIACAKSRHERAQSALDPSKKEEYAQHFRSTIGHEPTATAPLDFDLLSDTDPRKSIIPGPLHEAMQLMPFDDIEKLCQFTARGKATGEDGIYGEYIAHCPGTTADVLADLFWLIIMTRTIPSRWRNALVALVWKKKGSNLDISNYRPISLISRIRMIFEGGLRHHLERLVESNVDIAQGGFRPGRSTLDQVMGLHEIIAQQKGKLPVVYLDIKAAYDCVDRRLLWTRLAHLDDDQHRQRTHNLLIPLLRQLFDLNSAIFLVSGQQSNPLTVQRGLLQGTVLAPMLFNIYINDLPKRLRIHHPTIRLDHRSEQQGCESDAAVNSLFFADDAALFAESVETVQDMLHTCDVWAQETGTTWAPSKCEAVGFPQRSILRLSNATIPHYDRKTYLGMIFSRHGVEMLESINTRIRKASTMLAFLKARGFNGNGMRYLASRRHYFTFIRSMAEYGIALKILNAEERLPLERLQQRALSTLFSVSVRSATVSMRTILGISSIKTRNELLHAQFLQRIHCNASNNNTAVIIYRATINTRYPSGPTGRLSIIRPGVRDNPRWTDLQPPPLRPLAPPNCIHRVHGSRKERDKLKPAQPISRALRDEWYEQDFTADVQDILRNPRGARTTLMLQPPRLRQPYHIINELLPRSIERAIVLWMLGSAIARDYCHGCNTEVNENRRQHAILCSQIGEEVKHLYDPPLEEDDNIYILGGTIIDIALQDERTWLLNHDFPQLRQQSLRRLHQLAKIINRTRFHYTGQPFDTPASEATARDEVHAIMSNLPPHAIGRRFIHLRLMLRQVIRQHFSKTTANTLRQQQRQEHVLVTVPPRPPQAQIDAILDHPEVQHLLR